MQNINIIALNQFVLGAQKFADYFTSVAETANQYLVDVSGFLERMNKSMTTAQKVGWSRAQGNEQTAEEQSLCLGVEWKC
jgi:hypothetical protein